jgi:hypothetical protein
MTDRSYLKIIYSSIVFLKERFSILLIAAFLTISITACTTEPKVNRQPSKQVSPAQTSISTNYFQIPTTLEWDVANASKKAAEFAWTSFIALNSPADEQGQPIAEQGIGQSPTSPRIWECFGSPDDKTWPDQCPKSLVAQLSKAKSTITNPDRRVGLITKTPLIDRQKNFVVYEIRINKDEFTQLKAVLNTDKIPTEFEFVASAGENGKAAVSPIELKAAWRVFDDRNSDIERSSYYTTKKNVCIPSGSSSSGQKLCQELDLGLIGLHLAQKLEWQGAKGTSWIWSTFEHINNVELATKTQTIPTLYDPACSATDCPVNKEPEGNPKWQTNSPHASLYSPGQIQRNKSVPIQIDAIEFNKKWQQALNASVWKNYQLIGTNFTPISDQCKPSRPRGCLSATKDPKLLNVSMEPYPYPFLNCASCHIHAKLSDGKTPTDFSFLVGEKIGELKKLSLINKVKIQFLILISGEIR